MFLESLKNKVLMLEMRLSVRDCYREVIYTRLQELKISEYVNYELLKSLGNISLAEEHAYKSVESEGSGDRRLEMMSAAMGIRLYALTRLI